MAQNGNYSFIRNLRNTLRSFVFDTVLSANDTPMRRHEIAIKLANGFGLYMISQFSPERRDQIRTLTQTHFRNHTSLLLDIVLDSNSEIVFEQRLIEWISTVFSAWIYKLSLKYSNRLEGVKKLFVQLIMNSTQYLTPNANQSDVQTALRSKLREAPKMVDLFLQKAKKFHLVAMQKQHSSQQQSSSAVGNASNRNS